MSAAVLALYVVLVALVLAVLQGVGTGEPRRRTINGDDIRNNE